MNSKLKKMKFQIARIAVKFGEIPLEDGSIIYYPGDGTPQVGYSVVDEEGNVANNCRCDYDGNTIVIEDGVITEIKPIEEVEMAIEDPEKDKTAEDQTKEVEKCEDEDPIAVRMQSLENRLTSIEESTELFASMIKELSTTVSAINGEVQQMSAMPLAHAATEEVKDINTKLKGSSAFGAALRK